MIIRFSLVDIFYFLSCLIFGISCLSGISTLIAAFVPFQFSNGEFQRLPPSKVGYSIPISMSVSMLPDTVISYTNGATSFNANSYANWYEWDRSNSAYSDSMKRVVEADSNYNKVMVINKWVTSPGLYDRERVQSLSGKSWFEILDKEVAQSALVPMISDINTTVEIKVRGKTKWQNLMLGMHGYLRIFLYIFISFHIMQLLQGWRREMRFLNNLHKRIELVGKVLIYSQVLYFIFSFVYGKYFGSIRLVSAASDDRNMGSIGSINIHFNPTSTASLAPFLIGIGLLILSKFFQHGQSLESELDEMEQEQATNELANAQLQQDLLQVENNFLRAQVNPHFLYNTLNVFYAKALPANKDLANGILTLADIMRYSLEATESGQLVPLQMEVAHLQRVIAIHQLRFDNQLNIKLTVEGQYENVSVAPLIFITLLENALKHGELDDPAHPVTVWLATDATHIYFTIHNKKADKPKEYSHGIGLDNIKKRLNNVYGSHYRLVIEETNEQYDAVLTIKYNPEAEGTVN